MNRKKKVFIITTILLIALVSGGFIFFFLNQEKEQKEEKPVPFIEEELVHEEIVHPERPLTFPEDRTLVRTWGEIDVFWIQNKKRYLVLSPQIIELMAEIAGWGKIKEISPKTLEDYSRGPDFIAPQTRSDGLLIRMKGTDYIFLMSQGKREYLSQEEFQNKGYSQEDIIEVSTKIVKMLPPAPPVDHLSLQESVKRGKIEIIGSGKYFEEGVVFVAGPYEKNTAINIEKGDVLLSKTRKQSLVVTQDFEVFVPKGQKITLEGLWVACIDRFLPWPSAGEKLDVTFNLKDWKIKVASSLLDLIKVIDKKKLHKEAFAQKAIWKITDDQPVDAKGEELLREAGIDPGLKISFLHLTNPNPSPKTIFVITPELSLPGLIANYIENCPKIKEADRIICQQEMEFATKAYLKNQDFPGTVGQKIDSKILALLISLYIAQKPIDETLSPVSQEEINNTAETIVESLRQKGMELPPFEVKEVKVLPGHIIEQESATFSVEGNGIKDIKIKIFNLKSEKVFEGKRVFGNLFEWYLHSDSGEVLPNGFYSYQIEVRGFEEKDFFENPKRQLIIRL